SASPSTPRTWRHGISCSANTNGGWRQSCRPPSLSATWAARGPSTVRGLRQHFGIQDDRIDRADLARERAHLRDQSVFLRRKLGEALLELAARAVDAFDAVEASAKLQVMFLDLGLERRHHCLQPALEIAV